jgi:predicted dinucleotide-binding enzyme
MVGLDLSAGATLGIVGYGRIGRAVARRARAFGMRMLATPSRARVWDADAARAAAALPAPVADPDLVAAAATIDPAALTVAEVDALLEVAGVGGGKLPERMAPVHALVAALPRPVAERLLAGVLDLVYRPSRP